MPKIKFRLTDDGDLFKFMKKGPKMYDFRLLLLALNDFLPDGIYLRSKMTPDGADLLIVDSDSSIVINYDVINKRALFDGRVIAENDNMEELARAITSIIS